MGYRGSSSSQASEYKLKGHKDEVEFANLIDGSNETDDATGKTDVIGKDGKKYTVKGGKKKWQIFLYGEERFKNDLDFQSMNGIGQLLIECLNSFPPNYNVYKEDKAVCKKILLDYSKDNPYALKDLDKLKQLLPSNNTYFSSKISLSKYTSLLKSKFEDRNNLRLFLDKAIFNMIEVDRLAIKQDNFFLVFEKKDVLDIFANFFSVENSVGGNIPTDLNIDGQKVLFKYKTNVVEIEIRNDSVIHYRQVRFNMLREKALDLIKEKTKLINQLGEKVFFFGLK
jgi:hypothetical protein